MRSFPQNHHCKIIVLTCLFVLVCLARGLAQTTPKASPTPLRAGDNHISDFDAARAYNHVKQMVEAGPHPAGSPAIKKVQDYIEKE